MLLFPVCLVEVLRYEHECSASEAEVGRHCLRLKSVLRVTITSVVESSSQEKKLFVCKGD